jgi:predicted transcriptional regulator
MTAAEKVITVNTDEDIMSVAQKFKLHEIRHLIVIDDSGEWVAVLDTNELLDAVIKNINEEELQKSQTDGEFRS